MSGQKINTVPTNAESKNMSDDLKKRMGESIGKIKTFNGLLVVLVLLLFSVFFMISLSIYFEFRSHLCTFSNVRKCVASDKFCATKSQIQHDNNFAVEYLTNQNIGINTDLTQVINQTVQVGYYNYDNTTKNIGTSVFNIDFNFTDSVPSGGVNDILSLGPSVGYHVNPSSGVSIYLYPFAGKTIDGVSVAQIDKVISEGMSASSDVAYIDEPLEGSKSQFNNNNKAGVVFVSDVDDYQFKLGTYILMSYANANPKNLSLTSSQVGVSSLFTNFQKSDSIPYQEIISNISAVNITEIIKLNNYSSRQNCNDTNKTGCTCVDPAVRFLPNCNGFTYDPTTGIYTPHSGKNSSTGGSVRFCSYLANSGAADSSQAIATNVPTSYSSFTKDGTAVNYYKNGFGGEPVPSSDLGSFKKDRYNLPSIFCSNVPGNNIPNDYKPENNSLYQEGSTEDGYSSVGTSVWNSQNPNATVVGNLVNLGHRTN